MDNLKLLKKALRKEMLKVLSNIPPLERERQGRIVQEKILAHEYYKQSKHVAIYLHMDSQPEIPTDLILRDLLSPSSTKSCYVPLIEPQHDRIRMLKVYSLEDLAGFPRNKWGIPEPPADNNREDPVQLGTLDLVLCPGLAFDRIGARLGRGKAYYDRFLRHCAETFKAKGKPPPHTIGVAFNEQLLPSVPHGDTDYIVDEVVTAGDATPQTAA